jgi:Tfp pilus assembly protein PilN
MITINLLPPEYRRAKKSTSVVPYLPLAVLFMILFFILTLFFYADYLKVRKAYKAVHKEWLQLRPQMQELKALESKVEVELRGEKEFYEKYILNTDSMTRIMQLASEYLPPRMWLTELKVGRNKDGGRIVLQGVSLPYSRGSAIEQIEEYTKKIKEALPKSELSLTTAKQEERKSSEGTTFTATYEWGGKPA